MKDTQKRKFYDFEQYIIKRYLPGNLGDGLTLSESKDLINKICASYNVKPPNVKNGRADSGRAYYKTLGHTIVLPPWAQRYWVVIHEVAHAIVREKQYDDPGHDVFYVMVWMDLFSRMYDIPKETLQKEALYHGIRYKS